MTSDRVYLRHKAARRVSMLSVLSLCPVGCVRTCSSVVTYSSTVWCTPCFECCLPRPFTVLNVFCGDLLSFLFVDGPFVDILSSAS